GGVEGVRLEHVGDEAELLDALGEIGLHVGIEPVLAAEVEGRQLLLFGHTRLLVSGHATVASAQVNGRSSALSIAPWKSRLYRRAAGEWRSANDTGGGSGTRRPDPGSAADARRHLAGRRVRVAALRPQGPRWPRAPAGGVARRQCTPGAR